MADLGMKNRIPGIHKKTGKFVVRNIYNTNYGVEFYSEPHMYKDKLGEHEIDFDQVKIKRTRNKCPSCRQFTLNFDTVACWD